MSETEKYLSINQCYTAAWKAFKKWWIPLCLVSSLLFLFEMIPRIALRTEQSEIAKKTLAFGSMVYHRDIDQLIPMGIELVQQINIYSNKAAKVSVALFPIAALLTIVLLMIANNAMNNKTEKKSIGRLLYITFTHVILAPIKASAFLFFIFPGFYIYIKMLFVSLCMLEEDQTLQQALKTSWKLTDGHFWTLFALITANTLIQITAIPTLIGLIPATGFVNTARAAAFHTLRNQHQGTA